MSKKRSKAKHASVIPSKFPTEASLLADAKRAKKGLPRLTLPLVDILAETREMMLARGDAKELGARRYKVSDASFERIRLLAKLLGARPAEEAEVTEDRSESTEEANVARERLVEIREQLSLIGEAGGIEAAFFSIDTRRYDLMISSMNSLINRVVRKRRIMPDPETVDVLIKEARQLIEHEQASRLESAGLERERHETMQVTAQLKRMLVEELRHLSKQGLAAFPGDVKRELWYRLDRFSVRSKSKATVPVAPDAPELQADGVAV